MGNASCAICKTTLVSSCVIKSSCSSYAKRGKVVKVMKTDGKVMTFTTPILVKDVLMRLSRGGSGGGGGGYGIGVSKEANSERLPSDYELKVGKVYYVLPCLSYKQSFSPANDGSTDGIKRIKIVITKQQLRDLLAEQISVEEVLSGMMEKKTSLCTTADHRSAEYWKPNLESIPEGGEGLCSWFESFQHVM